MSQAPFRPFETNLDHDRALSILCDALSGADDGELFLERRRSEVTSFDDGRLKTASYDASEGFGLRAVRGEAAGYAHSTTIDEHALRRAAETARLAVGAGGGTLAEGPKGTNTALYADIDPVESTPFPVKVETLREIDAFARQLDPRVVQVSATISAVYQEVVILRPEGRLVSDVRPMARINVSVIVEENGRRESGGTGTGGRHGLDRLLTRETWEGQVREALRIAVVNLGAEPAPAGVMDVVLGPGWPGILLHEAVGHGLEGDFNRKGSSAFAGLMGQEVAARGVTVLDDGTLPDRRGSLTVDDDVPPLSPPLGKALGLTIREAVTNIVRHSKADSARIHIEPGREELTLTVSDNGVGTGDASGSGAGLDGVRKRITALGGDMQLTSSNGTELSVSLPFADEFPAGSRA